MNAPEPGQSQLVKLGEHTLTVVPQKHARLRHEAKRLGFHSPEELLLNLALPVGGGHDRYDLLCIAIPDMRPRTDPETGEQRGIPRWEWDGFASEEAAAEDRYEEGADRSPDYDQIVAAGHAVITVNGVGRLGKIVGLLTTMQRMGENSPNGNSTPTALASPGSSGE